MTTLFAIKTIGATGAVHCGGLACRAPERIRPAGLAGGPGPLGTASRNRPHRARIWARVGAAGMGATRRSSSRHSRDNSIPAVPKTRRCRDSGSSGNPEVGFTDAPIPVVPKPDLCDAGAGSGVAGGAPSRRGASSQTPLLDRHPACIKSRTQNIGESTSSLAPARSQIGTGIGHERSVPRARRLFEAARSAGLPCPLELGMAAASAPPPRDTQRHREAMPRFCAQRRGGR